MHLSAFQKLLTVFSVGLIYFVVGKLSLLLSMPPGFAATIWPPAGIALACTLHFGNWILPGIFLGAFAFNIQNYYYSSPWPVAILLSCGSVLQAYLGQRLVKKSMSFPNPLNEEGDILKFIFLGGVVSCLISPTVGSTVLVALGIVPKSGFLLSWGTWWVGAVIGVIVFAPMVLIFLQEPKKLGTQRGLFLIIPFVIAFSASVTVFQYAKKWEQTAVQEQFEKRSTAISRAIQRKFENDINILHAVESLFYASKNVDPILFKNFVKDFLVRNKGIQSLSWDAHLSHAERLELERSWKAKGESYFFHERGANGVLVSSPARKEYVVPLFIEPTGKNNVAIGFDIKSDPIRKEAVARATIPGQPVMTSLTKLVEEDEGKSGFIIYLPVFKKSGQLMGYVAGVFRVDEFISAALQGVEKDKINFWIEDKQAPRGSSKFYGIASSDNSKMDAQEWNLNWFYEKEIGTRSLVFRFQKDFTYLTERRTWQTWMVLVMGLAFTGLFGAFLLVVVGRADRIEALVLKRTDELSTAKMKMISSSKMSALGEMAGGLAHEINTPLTVISVKVAQLKEMMKDTPYNIEKAIEHIGKIDGTIQRISKIIKGLRLFARDAQSDPFEVIKVTDLIDETLSFCSERFKHHGVQLIKPLIDENLTIQCRPSEISQVLLNLLNNAFDAVEDLPQRWVKIDVKEVDDQVNLTVTDSGQGIDVALRDKIMQPFFTTKPVGKGTGLGLSISSGIVESHHGKFVLDPKSPFTSFQMTLPKRQNSFFS